MKVTSGELPNRICVITDRVTPADAHARAPLSGPDGDEWWARVWKVLRLSRDDMYCTTLVKEIGMEAPTPAEVAAGAPHTRAELLRCKPEIILAVGYTAARWLLPQFADMSGDYFHGLPFTCVYGKLGVRTATVVPIVPPGLALAQPDRFQNALTDDLRCVRDVLAEARRPHTTKPPFVYRVGLASFGKPGQILASDTEGSLHSPECVTLAHGGGKGADVACIETWGGHTMSPFLPTAFHHAKSVAFHYALHDLKVLRTLGIENVPGVQDTMIEAYLLGLPQALKVLAFRELGAEMSEYEDLVQPLDDAAVRECLEQQLSAWVSHVDLLAAKAERIETKKAASAGKKKVTKKAIMARYKKLYEAAELPPKRVITALGKMLGKEAK